MKKRKLIRPDVLDAMRVRKSLGVAVAELMRQYLPDDSMTRPTVVKLLTAYDAIDTLYRIDASKKYLAVSASLNPDWLDPEGIEVQEQPDDWSYEGYFPLGRWICRT